MRFNHDIYDALERTRGSRSTYGAKDLLERSIGRFYTHELIGRHLVDAAVKAAEPNLPTTMAVVDPFCGDGRLVCWLMEAAARRPAFKARFWEVQLWDCDAQAIKIAGDRVKELAARHNLRVAVKAIQVDTFTHAPSQHSRFNIVLTNPPWETIKPDRREIRDLGRELSPEYTRWLGLQTKRLSALYSLSSPCRGYSGWGTNLSRCGTEVALRLTAPAGVCGVVSPASLLADQQSRNLRRWIMSEYEIEDIAYYPAEAKLFDGVDQAAVTLVAISNKPRSFAPKTTIYDRRRTVVCSSDLSLDWSELAAADFVAPVQLGAKHLKLLRKLGHFQRFVDLEGDGTGSLWAGRELDETRADRFLANRGQYLFAKGRMVAQYRMVEWPRQFVSASGPPVPRSAGHSRVAWRDVSRATQRRRIQATIIPPGWVTGNSLHVAYFRDDDSCRLKALLAIMNSLVFEFQVRASLGTGHVSLGAVRRARVPDLAKSSIVKTLCSDADACLAAGSSLAEVEIRIARLYDLSREEFSTLVSTFDRLDDREAQVLQSRRGWPRQRRQTT